MRQYCAIWEQQKRSQNTRTHTHTNREHKASDDGQPDLQTATETQADGDVGRGGVNSKKEQSIVCKIQQKRAKRSHDAAATATTTTTTLATTMTHTNKQEAERLNKREWRKQVCQKKRYRTLHSIGSGSSSDAGRGREQ